MDTKLNGMIKNLVTPKDYYHGVGEFTFPVPSEVMMFSRNSVDELIRNCLDVHHRYVLIVNIGEPISVLIDGESMELKSNSFILILPYQYHRYYNNDQGDISLYFLTFALEENIYFEQFRNMTFHYNENFNCLIKKLIRYYQNKNSQILPYFTGYFLSIILSESNPYVLTKDKSRVSQIIIEICKHIYKDKRLTIGGISKLTNMSDRYLRQIFKKAMGLTLGQYILEIKIYESMKYLASSDMNIGTIAEKSGYDSIYSFSRAFKNSVGVSPKEYRLNKGEYTFRFK